MTAAPMTLAAFLRWLTGVIGAVLPVDPWYHAVVPVVRLAEAAEMPGRCGVTRLQGWTWPHLDADQAPFDRTVIEIALVSPGQQSGCDLARDLLHELEEHVWYWITQGRDNADHALPGPERGW